ncbi:RNase adapter RapZ [Croceicoccus ponticola]|uniref:RNase adapter RapZ n=1 Tax=Croceicoccus ponticola TaxID=2217664 RepID=A0A437GVM4_9SPHN|nr:RNase adapter RapZ [Croceicoccus ponticola]RVQ65950.1 RNase adapter RapZ [Croceicoccus ponticola]
MTSESTHGSPPQRSTTQRSTKVLLVTGMLGAGKTTALRALEDLGWEPVDNFPVRLIGRLLHTAPGPGHEGEAGGGDAPLAIGFDSRTRGFDPHAIVAEIAAIAEDEDVSFTLLYLDCGAEELERRYNETRRRHPLAGDRPVAEGISAEREIMEPLRRIADVVISTTQFSTNDLQRTIRELFAPSAPQDMTVTVSSFGFSRGMVPTADLVFDMRFLDNPHWIDELRPLTGRDEPVAEHIRADPAWDEAFARIRGLVLMLLPRYEAQGKAYVNIAFGCTGGKHRSVFAAESLARALREKGRSPTLLHRNLDSGTNDLVEGSTRS